MFIVVIKTHLTIVWHSFEVRVKVLYWIRNTTLPEGQEGTKLKIAADVHHIPERTVRRWVFQGDITRQEYEENLSSCGRKRKLTDVIEGEIVNWVIDRHYNHKSTSGVDIITHVQDVYDISLSTQFFFIYQ